MSTRCIYSSFYSPSFLFSLFVVFSFALLPLPMLLLSSLSLLFVDASRWFHHHLLKVVVRVRPRGRLQKQKKTEHKEEEKESKGESLSIGHPCANLIALINLFFSQSNTYVRYFTCRFLKEFSPHGITPFLKRTLHLQLAHLHVHSQRKSENERTSENILSA